MQEKGKISFIVAVLMSVNIMIGSFIFVAPQDMAAMAGTYSFLSWAFAGLLLLPIVLVVAQAARSFPGEGGFYNYCKLGINETAGFLSNWAYLLGYLGTVSIITVLIRQNLVSLMGLTILDAHPYIFYLVFITLLSLLNLMSVEIISKIQSIVTLLKLSPLFIVAILIFFYWNPNITYQTSDLCNLGITLPFAFFGFWGFESCCSLGHLVKGGPKQLARVILVAFSVAVVLNVVFHLGVLNIMGLDNLMAYGATAFPSFLGLNLSLAQALLVFVSFAFMLSLLNTTYGASLANITNIVTFAKQRSIFGSSWLSKKMSNGTSINAVILHGIVVFALVVLIGNIYILNSVTNFGISFALLLVLIAMFLYNFRNKNWGKLVITILGFMSLFTLLYYSWMQAGSDNLIRLLYLTPVIVGFPAGYLMYRVLKGKK